MGLLRPLAAAAKGARLAAGRKQIDIATTAGVSHTTISRFERGASWPLDPDRIIGAYAEECGVAARDIWERALGTKNAPDPEGPKA